MDFAVTLEKKEMEVIAWMLKTRTKTHIIEACKGLVLGLIVLAVEIYNIFYYEESTAAQVIILTILAVVCFGKTVLSYLKMINYNAIAERKNKTLKGKTVTYSFKDEGVFCGSEGGTESIEWAKFTEWGEYNGCVFVMFGGGVIIILDEEKYDKEVMKELKQLLMQKAVSIKISL